MPEEKCHTERCEEPAEYWFGPGKAVVCHGCFERLKELIEDADEQNRANEEGEKGND